MIFSLICRYFTDKNACGMTFLSSTQIADQYRNDSANIYMEQKKVITLMNKYSAKLLF